MAGSLVKKLGKLALAIIIIGTLFICLSFALLLSLWSAHISNTTYQLIIVNNWLNNAVSILSEVLKQAISFQIGVGAAMCAAIALERFSVVLPEVASCLAIRSDYSVWNSAFMFWKGAPRKGHVSGVSSRTVTALSLVLLIVACIIQADSILLISDVDLSQVQGMTQLGSVPYGFEYQVRVNGSFVDVSRRGIVTIPPKNLSSTAFSDFSSSTSTQLDPTSISSTQSSTTTWDAGQGVQATLGPQGIPVHPGGWSPPASNDPSFAAPIVKRQSTWNLEPVQYPAFAEYHEAPPTYDTDGIDDTGKTLRAFLPYADVRKRNTLQNFTGRTTVLDSRVTCQTPALGNLSATPMDNGYSIMFNGTVVPLHNTPRLFNDTAFYDRKIINPNEAMRTSVPAPFSCVVPNANSLALSGTRVGYNFPALENGKTDELLVLCQLADGGAISNSQVSGGLVSEFVDIPDPASAPASAAMQNFSSNTGVAYMLIKVQDLKDSYWGRAWGNDSTNMANMTGQVLHGQWTDFPYHAGDKGIAISTTLCYAAFDSANLQVSASTSNSTADRTDPVPQVNTNSNTTIVDFSLIRSQLTVGPGKISLTPEQRGILHLAPRSSWLANGAQEKSPAISYLRDLANPAGALGVGNTGNMSLALWNLESTDDSTLPWVKVDPYHVYLFQQTLREDLGGGGSPAHALQALITVLSSMSFYSQLPQFTASAEAEQTWFVSANVPVRSTGLTVVAVTTLVHLITMMVITTLFLRECKLSMLGAGWQSLLQGTRGEAAELGSLEALDAMRDAEVEELLASVGKSDLKVGVGRNAVDGRVYLMAHDDPSMEKRNGSSGAVQSPGKPVQKRKMSGWVSWPWRKGRKQSCPNSNISSPEVIV